MPSSPRVWLITGASRGLGHAFAQAALAAGDRVVALSRTPAELEGDVLVLTADVTDRAAVFAGTEQAVAPHLRASGGRLLQVSSIGGVVSGPLAGLYSATKFALEGLTEALAQELAPLGVKTTLVEPGGYWTDLYTSGMHLATPLDVYAPLREGGGESIDSEPQLAAAAVMRLVDSDDPPLRLILGSAVLDAAIDITTERIATWRRWETVSRAAERAVPA